MNCYYLCNGKILQDPSLAPPNSIVYVYPRVLGGVAFPDPGHAPTTAATTAQTATIQSIAAGEKLSKYAQFVKTITTMKMHFMTFMRAIFQFFVVIVVFRMIIGFFSKPLEFIMLGISCIVLAIAYVIYVIFLVTPFNTIACAIWFFLFQVCPLLVYTIINLLIFVLAILILAVLHFLNERDVTDGGINKLLMCHNSVASWYKTPNFHLKNEKKKGLFCRRECLPGYYPSATGTVCVRQPYYQPSYCPQAQVMRMYMDNKIDLLYSFNDYNTIGNVRYLSKNPEQREKLMKKYYLEKLKFLNTCDIAMKKYDVAPLTICASLDILQATENINDFTIKRLKRVCNQAYCNSKTTYGFCSFTNTDKEESQESFWVKLIKIIISIMIMIFIIIVIFELLSSANGKTLLEKFTPK